MSNKFVKLEIKLEKKYWDLETCRKLEKLKNIYVFKYTLGVLISFQSDIE